MTKTKDGRFKENRIKLTRSIQRDLILKAKKNNHLTWEQLAQKLNVSTHTLKHG